LISETTLKRGRVSSLAQTVSRFVARIEAEQVLRAITTCNANENIELEYYR